MDEAIRREPLVSSDDPEAQYCEACGSPDVYMHYREYAARWSAKESNGYIYDRHNRQMDDDPRLQHLACTCRRCGYRWGIPTIVPQP